MNEDTDDAVAEAGAGDTSFQDLGETTGAHEVGDATASDDLGDVAASSPDDAGDGALDADVVARSPLWPTVVLASGAVVLVLDQITKWYAQNNFRTNPRHVFWELDFIYTTNTGASFSLGDGFGPFIGVLVIVVSVALFWFSRQAQRVGVMIASGMVLGGSLGNFTDRVFRAEDGPLSGAVIDMIKFTDSYPVFNVADMGIVVGGFLIVILGGFGEHPAKP